MPSRRTAALGAALVVAYIAAARLGFTLAIVAEQVTTVWAPTGLAQAALLLWGRRLWPAIWLGAFAVNAGADAPLWTAVAIATGNTLEAVAAAWVLARAVRFDPALGRTREGVAFLVVAAGLSPTISATIGVGTLCAAGVQPWPQFPVLWFDWWLGDAIGALIVGPVILTIARASAGRNRRAWAETGALVAGTMVVTEAAFGQRFGPTAGYHPLEYVIFPFLVAAAVRHGQPATALVVAAAAAVAIWNTAGGSGPFAGPDVHASLVLLQLFMGVVAATGLLLAAAITERRTSERRRGAAQAVGEILADAPALAHAALPIVQAVCEHLDWSTGALWIVDHSGQRLRCLAVWTRPSEPAGPFATATSERVFERGVGLPGRVWASGDATWIEDVAADGNFPRAALARQAGLHSAFAFPIRMGPEVQGVLEFFNRSIVAPDAELLGTMSTVGHQLGQFVVRKRVEAAVVEGQRHTDAILETALDAIIGMDDQGLITEFNPAAVRTFGYSREEAIGRELADLIIPDALRAGHRDGLRRYLVTGTGPFMDRRIETSARHADGHDFPVEVAITRVLEEGSPRFTGFVRDLTSQMHAQQEREQLLQRELTARRDAEAANRAKDEFLATLSHELRTPLNAIVGWTRMLLDGTLDELSRRRALEVIDRNAQLQAQLVADLLDVSGIITGGLKLSVAPVDLGAVITSAIDALNPAAQAKQIHVHANLVPGNRLTEGDGPRLQQVVWNLVANAIKFTPAGGRIDVDLADPGTGRWRILVRDNGAGIDPEFLPYVFDRFRQADGSASRQHGGLGLGLAIVRHLVELHGGRVRAESAGPGQGSTFVVELPSRHTGGQKT